MAPGPSRRPPKTGKGAGATPQIDQIPPSYYTDDEAALEAGTALEEKAERFAVGWKAQKYYEKSLALYQRAIALNEKGADASYNCARVLFLLATDFLPPPLSIDALKESERYYRRSLSLTPPMEQGLPSAFYLDIQYNLAVALLALSDQLDHAKVESSLRLNAIHEAILLFTRVIDGQELVLHRQKLEEESSETEIANDISSEQNPNEGEEEVMSLASEDQEAEADSLTRSEYTTSLITPAAALDTLHNLHTCSLALMDGSYDEDGVQEARQLSQKSLQRAEAIFVAFPDGEKRSPDDEWNDNVGALRFAPLECKVAHLAKSTTLVSREGVEMNTALVTTADELMRESNALLLLQSQQSMDLDTTSGRSKHRIYTQHLEHLGDMLLTLARISLFNTVSEAVSKEASTSDQRTWSLLGLSSKLILATLKSIDTSTSGAGSSAVLGASNSSTIASRRRCSLYTTMSTLSILRSSAHFFETVPGLDRKTREQLFNNGRVYARKAVSEVGLGWLLTLGGSSRPQYTPPHGGLDSLEGEATAILTLLRSLYKRSEGLGLADDMVEVKTVCANVRQILMTGEHAPAWNWIFFYPEGPTQGMALLDQVIEEEGMASVTETERQFWAQIEVWLLPQ